MGRATELKVVQLRRHIRFCECGRAAPANSLGARRTTNWGLTGEQHDMNLTNWGKQARGIAFDKPLEHFVCRTTVRVHSPLAWVRRRARHPHCMYSVSPLMIQRGITILLKFLHLFRAGCCAKSVVQKKQTYPHPHPPRFFWSRIHTIERFFP